jgi:hypothetical protein
MESNPHKAEVRRGTGTLKHLLEGLIITSAEEVCAEKRKIGI